MSPNHKDHTDLKNWKKKISQGKLVSCSLCFVVCLLVGWFVLFFLKMKQRKSKSNLSFWFREHWGRGKETAKYKIYFFSLSGIFWSIFQQIWLNFWMKALEGSSHIWPHVFSSVAAQPLAAHPHRAGQKSPLDQSLQEMGLPFLSNFSSEDRDAGGCQKRQLFFSRAFFFLRVK